MSSQELAFLIIEEETDSISSRRIAKLESIFNKLNINCISSHNPETTIKLFIDNANIMPDYILINIEINSLDEILKKINEQYDQSAIILLYSSYSNESLPIIKIDYSIKYDLERNDINLENIESLTFKIKSDFVFKQQIQKYSYIKCLCSGVSSIVDLYNDNILPRQVAVKKMYIKDNKIKGGEAETEKNNIMKIKVPTCIELYDIIVLENFRFICMEYADQKTLENKILETQKEKSKINTNDIFDILVELLLGLYALNEKGYMHQDIKSENILLKKETINEQIYEIAKLSEPGFSRKLDGIIGSKTPCGTPYYLSPELCNDDEKYDFNCDIWSLGIVLFELVTNKLPWYKEKINYKDFLKLVINTKKMPFPENMDEKLKYLIQIMLKKDPNRRATLKEIITLDFIYEKIEAILDKFNWWKYYEGIKELKKSVKPCYLFMDLLSEESLKYMSDASKIFIYCQAKDYTPGYFTSTYKAKNGKDILDLYNDLKKWGTDSINYKQDAPNNLLFFLLSNQIIHCISHPIKNYNDDNEVIDLINNFLNEPSKYNFQSSFDFEPNQYIDNKKIFIPKSPKDEEIDYLTISQFVLNNGLELYEQNIKKNIEVEQLPSDRKYLNFLYGISLFSECDILQIPYDKKDHSRLAFLLNLYQIMILHFVLNEYQNNCKRKSGLLSYFSYEIGINYQFKNFTLNNLELKHAIFRNNKPVPGSYLRLLYQSDVKCSLLPEFKDLRPLLILYDLNKDISNYIFKIFNSKEVDQQLDDITYKFIQLKIILSAEDELFISSHIKPIIKDFGANDTEQNPREFLLFLIKFLNKNNDHLTKEKGKPYLSKLTEEEYKSVSFLDKKLVDLVFKGNIKISYI
jgi:serine/threonine protein kinase